MLFLTSLVACGAVTDPLDDHTDPRPILGEWYTPSFSDSPELHGARIQGGAGTLFGEFRVPLHGRSTFVQFRDARWDGRALLFSTETDFGFTLADPTIRWVASLSPERGRPGSVEWDPARLSLTAHTEHGRAFSWDYFRYEDLIALSPGLEDAPIH